MRRCDLYPQGEPEPESPYSLLVVGKCYSIRELMDRTLAGMPTPVSSFPVVAQAGDTSDLFDDDEDDMLVHLSNLRDLTEQVEHEQKSSKEQIIAKDTDDEQEKSVEKPVGKPVDKSVDK